MCDILCNLLECVYVAVYLCCSFWIDCWRNIVSFKNSYLAF